MEPAAGQFAQEPPVWEPEMAVNHSGDRQAQVAVLAFLDIALAVSVSAGMDEAEIHDENFYVVFCMQYIV